MFKKPQIIISVLIIILLSFFVGYRSGLLYPQSDKSNDDSAGKPLTALNKPPLAIGQWVLYEINVSQLTSSPILVKISIVDKEIIENETWFWEEVSLFFSTGQAEGITIKSLRKSFDDQPERIIFQRAGLPAIELDPNEIGRKLNIAPREFIPEIYTFVLKTQPVPGSRSENPSGFEECPKGQAFPITTPLPDLPRLPDGQAGRQTNRRVDVVKKIKYKVPATKEKIVCQKLVYNNPEQGSQVIAWISEHIPLTGFTKITCVSKGHIISVKLVNFGFTGASSLIKGKVLKFGEIYPSYDK